MKLVNSIRCRTLHLHDAAIHKYAMLYKDRTILDKENSYGEYTMPYKENSHLQCFTKKTAMDSTGNAQ